MRLRKIDKFLFWMLMGVILLVFIVLFLATVKPVGAASVCGPLVGPAAVVDDALTLANVPHLVIEDRRSNPTCAMVGCPKSVSRCYGWRVRMVATPTRWLELAFGRTGNFLGVR